MEKTSADDGASLTGTARTALESELSRCGLTAAIQRLAEPEGVTPPRRVVTLRQFVSVPEALLAKGLLDSVGIESFLADENTIRTDWFWSDALSGVQFQVGQTDAENAMEILNQTITEGDDSEEDTNEDRTE